MNQDSRPRIVLLVGLPGSGKSTYAKRRGLPVLSSDVLRELLSGDVNNQNIHARVFATLRYLLRQRLAIGQPVTVVDATNLTRQERRPYREIARKLDVPIEAVHFDTPLEVCLARNAARGRIVPEDVIRRMAARLQPPTPGEGFARVTIVRPD
jgi:predicted kinase